MAETIKFRDIRLESGWLCVRPEHDEMWKAMAVMRNHKDRHYDLEIKEHREKRSLSANAYAWLLIGKLAEAARVPQDEIYLEAVRNLGGNTMIATVEESEQERFCECWRRNGIGWPTEVIGPTGDGMVDILCYRGSSTYDSSQMARLIDGLVQDCKAVGIETLPPWKLAGMLEEWA